ncbi:hypothetical protein NP233_g2287 [Leucocoprinus birnbaumii]|uniref:F-box domain-containing protein n=1 Tax=Leucocoprinus birnbaumii TaxID=56174 RepID=A0AAD5W0K0_9AGAR|nr:hypothetical protein NP233_g2287 [Leucocoprinus birnbaumii]
MTAAPFKPVTKFSLISSDILIEILQYIVNKPLDPLANEAPPQLHICQVCRQWKDLVLSSPSLWTNLYLSPRCTFGIQQYLERSMQSFIKISIAFPDSLPTSKFIQQLETLLPPHLERIRELSIHLCDCHTVDVFSTIGIFSHTTMPHLAVFEILEVSDPLGYYMKRGITRAIPKANLPWSRNLHRLCVPGYWLHMAVTGLRPKLTSLEIDDSMLAKRSFKAMLENMPALTSLILHDQNNVKHSLVDLSDAESPLQINIPSLRLLRFHEYDHLGPDSGGVCHCLVKTVVAPNLETLEICLEHQQAANPDDDFDWDKFYLGSERSGPDVLPTACIFDEMSLLYWNGPSSQLKKLRLENVPCPQELIKLVTAPIDIEYVYSHELPNSAENIINLPTLVPTSVKSVTLDLSLSPMECDESRVFWPGLGPASEVLQRLSQTTAITSHDASSLIPPVKVYLSKTIPQKSLAVPQHISIRNGSTKTSSEGVGTCDDLGYLARRRYWMVRDDLKTFHRYYQHQIADPPTARVIKKDMEVEFSDALIDSDDDHIWNNAE